jgi:DNA-binding LacI/PurR family transcriptional regulator
MQKHQATIKEIAAKLGVSASTVSRALQNDPRIGLRTRNRVIETARALHYVPNGAAAQLRRHRTRMIGVVLPSLREEFFSMAITSIEDVLDAQEYTVLMGQSRDKADRERHIVLSFIRSRVDGVIASLAADTTDYAHFAELREFGIPVVFFDRVPPDFPAHRVRCNITDGVLKAMRYLADRGIRQIALLNGPDNLDIAKERLTGFLQASAELNLEVFPHFIKSVDLTEADTQAKMQELCANSPLPQAIVAFNDYVALDAMQWCKRNGIVPNQDIVFVSFANLPITTYMDNPPAASIEQFAGRMGHSAASILLQALNFSNAEEMPFQEMMFDTELRVH